MTHNLSYVDTSCTRGYACTGLSVLEKAKSLVQSLSPGSETRSAVLLTDPDPFVSNSDAFKPYPYKPAPEPFVVPHTTEYKDDVSEPCNYDVECGSLRLVREVCAHVTCREKQTGACCVCVCFQVCVCECVHVCTRN